MSEDGTFSLSMRQIKDFEFETSFDWEHLPPMILDEPEPIGHRKGPNASRLLGAAVGNCLSASLLFCLQKSRVSIDGMQTDIQGHITRNEKGRMRVTQIDVNIVLEIPGDDHVRVSRCIGLFEDYCVVTGSVRKAIDVNVTVVDREGHVLFDSTAVEA